jgi:hypothetical protein
LAGFFRIRAILTLALGPGKAEDGPVFDVYCSRHEARVLLSPDDILGLVNHPDGIALHWRCSCGHVGVRLMSRSRGGGPRTRKAA